MNIRNSFDIEREALLLQPVAGWSMADMPEPAEWLISGCFNAEGELREPLEQGWEEFPLPSLAFGDEDEDDDIEDDEDNFDDMEDDFEDDFEDEDDDFEDEDDDFEDEDDDFEDEDEDDDYDYDEDGDFDDDFEE
ncbi:MAG: hypothetical protein LBU19_11260 [Treponema sp.]|nr:hypothetical protein [Treponema sp.]